MDARRAPSLGTTMISKGRAAVALVALVAAAFGAWTAVSYRADIRRARERVAAGSTVVETPCGPIEYAVRGSGPPVLSVHGAGGGFDQGLALAGELAERGYRVIAMSRFGYLRTPLPAAAGADAQSDSHACLLDALGIERAAVMGTSAGAPSALQFAIRHPQRTTALVLLVPAAYVPREGGAASVHTPPRTPLLFDTALRSDFLFWAAARLAPDTMTRSILGTPPEVVRGASAEDRRRVAELLAQILPVSSRRLGLLNDAAVVGGLEGYALDTIGAPTLAVSVEDDGYGTYDAARYSAEHIRGARFIGYPTGGHMLVGHYQEVMAAVADFLRGPH